MRKHPTNAELIEHEVETEAHKLVFEWQSERGERYGRETFEIIGEFASWLLTRRPPAGNVLLEVATRLTPNPALTPAGTLAIILDGIDRIPDEWLARTISFVSMRDVEGAACSPVTDEQWRDGDLATKMRLLQHAKILKTALREASKP